MKDAAGVELAVGDRVAIADQAWHDGKKSIGVFFGRVVRFTPQKIVVSYEGRDTWRESLPRQSHQVLKVS